VVIASLINPDIKDVLEVTTEAKVIKFYTFQS